MAARVEIEIDPTRASTGARLIKRDLFEIGNEADRTVARTNRMGSQIGTGMLAGRRGVNQFTEALVKHRGVVRQTGLQLNQVAQVAGMTGNVMGALAVQLPDLLLPFGTLGIFAGVAAGAMIPLMQNMFDVGSASDRMEESLSEVTDGVDSYISMIKEAGLVSDTFEDNISSLSDTAKKAAGELAQSELDQAIRRIDEAFRDLGDDFRVQDRFDFSYILRQFEATSFFNPFKAVDDEVSAAAANLIATFEAIEKAGTLEDRIIEAADLARWYEILANSNGKISEEEEIALSLIRQMIIEMDRLRAATAAVADEAERVTDEFSNPVSLQAQFDQQSYGAAITNTAMMEAQAKLDRHREREADRAQREAERNAARAARAGASAAREAQRELSQITSAYESLRSSLDPVYARTLEFERAQKTLNEALAAGVINQEEMGETLGMLERSYRGILDISRAAGQSVSDGLRGLITEAKTAAEAFNDLRLAIFNALYDKYVTQYITQGFDFILGSIFPNANGNAFSGGAVVPMAAGGIVDQPTFFPMAGNRTGLMGEAGPEAVMPLARGADGKLGVRSAGGGVKVDQNITINALSDGDIDRVLARRIPALRAATVDAVITHLKKAGIV